MGLRFLRKCILEALRINNNVVSLFRTAAEQVDFGNGYTFPEGTQFFVFTNPILRNPEYFDRPEEFRPNRWRRELEESHLASISFSRGPQRCPGKDIVILVVMRYIANFLRRVGVVCDRSRPFRTGRLNPKKNIRCHQSVSY